MALFVSGYTRPRFLGKLYRTVKATTEAGGKSLMSTVSFDDIWSWIQENLRASEVVKTLCWGVDNRIVEVKPDYIVVRSSRGKRDRRILEKNLGTCLIR